jgi:hypothetical protein
VQQNVCVSTRVVLVKVAAECTFIYGFVGPNTRHTILFNTSLPIYKIRVLYHITCNSPLTFTTHHYHSLSNPFPTCCLTQKLRTSQNYATAQDADRHPSHSDNAGFDKWQEGLTRYIDFTSSLTACFSFINDIKHDKSSLTETMLLLHGHCLSYTFNHSQGQPINLQRPWCLDKGKIIHELMHALGFYHTHNATNRDQYVTIHWENIKPGNVKVFICNKHNKDAPVPCAHRTHKILHLLHTQSTIYNAAIAVQVTCKYVRKYFGCNLNPYSSSFNYINKIYFLSLRFNHQ